MLAKNGGYVNLRSRSIISCLLLVSLWACNSTTTERASDPTSNEGTDGTSDDPVVSDPVTDETVDNDYFKVTVTAPSGKSVTLHKYEEAWDTACQIGVDDDPSDILCVIEGMELDLYAFDGELTLTYNFPKDLCKYALFDPYYFYQKRSGYGPSAMNMTVTNDVAVLNSTTDVTAGITAELDDTGTPVCTANYTDESGFVANCCIGEYTLTKNVDGTITVESGDWGGTLGACLAGPAITSQEKDRNDFPMADLIDMEGIGLNRDYEIDPPLSLGYFTNLYIANYFDVTNSFPGASAEAFPAGGTFDWDTAPVASQGAVVPANPWYEFACLDESEDYIHRIRVMIRAWSTNDQYDAGVAGSYNYGDNGTEEAYFSQQYLLDRYGWFTATGGQFGAWDLMAVYPGDSL